MSQLFKLKKSDIDRVTNKVKDIVGKEQQILLKKVTDITNIVFQTAHTKRPIITKAEMNASGRTRRVSNPAAAYGVPVSTGALQLSIKKEVVDSGKKVTGTVFVDPASPAAEYAKYMEYGTSRIAPRPFMRTAITQNQEWIKKYFKQKMS